MFLSLCLSAQGEGGGGGSAPVHISTGQVAVGGSAPAHVSAGSRGGVSDTVQVGIGGEELLLPMCTLT